MRMTGFISAAGILLALTGIAAAQVAEAPLLGYVFDAAAQGVRPIWGVPGAATIGDPVELGVEVTEAVVSPRQNYVLVLTGTDRATGLYSPKTGQVQALAGVPAGASRIVVSPEGDSAGFYFSDRRELHVVTGLPDAPSPPSVFAGLDEVGAISDDGAFAVRASDALAMTFLSRSHAGVVVTASGAVRESDLSAAASTRRPVSSGDLSDVTGVTVSADGQTMVVTHRKSGKVTVIGLSGAEPAEATLDCHCANARPVRINGTAAWRLSEYNGEPLALLDLGTGSPRVVLVPPAAEVRP